MIIGKPGKADVRRRILLVKILSWCRWRPCVHYDLVSSGSKGGLHQASISIVFVICLPNTIKSIQGFVIVAYVPKIQSSDLFPYGGFQLR